MSQKGYGYEFLLSYSVTKDYHTLTGSLLVCYLLIEAYFWRSMANILFLTLFKEENDEVCNILPSRAVSLTTLKGRQQRFKGLPPWFLMKPTACLIWDLVSDY